VQKILGLERASVLLNVFHLFFLGAVQADYIATREGTRSQRLFKKVQNQICYKAKVENRI